MKISRRITAYILSFCMVLSMFTGSNFDVVKADNTTEKTQRNIYIAFQGAVSVGGNILNCMDSSYALLLNNGTYYEAPDDMIFEYTLNDMSCSSLDITLNDSSPQTLSIETSVQDDYLYVFNININESGEEEYVKDTNYPVSVTKVLESYAGTHIAFRDFTSNSIDSLYVSYGRGDSDTMWTERSMMTYDNVKGIFTSQIPEDLGGTPYSKLKFFISEDIEEPLYEASFIGSRREARLDKTAHNVCHYGASIITDYSETDGCKKSWDKYISDPQSIAGKTFYISESFGSSIEAMSVDGVEVQISQESPQDNYIAYTISGECSANQNSDIKISCGNVEYHLTWSDITKNVIEQDIERDILKFGGVHKTNDTSTTEFTVDTTLSSLGSVGQSIPDTNGILYTLEKKGGEYVGRRWNSTDENQSLFNIEVDSECDWFIISSHDMSSGEGAIRNDYTETDKLYLSSAGALTHIYIGSYDTGGGVRNCFFGDVSSERSKVAEVLDVNGTKNNSEDISWIEEVNIYDYYSDYELNGKIRKEYTGHSFNYAVINKYLSEDDVKLGESEDTKKISEATSGKYFNTEFLTGNNTDRIKLGKHYIASMPTKITEENGIQYFEVDSQTDNLCLRKNNDNTYFLDQTSDTINFRGDGVTKEFYPFDSVDTSGYALNAAFAMDFRLSFFVPSDGCMTGENGQKVPVKLEVSGGDNIAVYLDGNVAGEIYSGQTDDIVIDFKELISNAQQGEEFDTNIVHNIRIEYLNRATTNKSRIRIKHNFPQIVEDPANKVSITDRDENDNIDNKIAYGRKISNKNLGGAKFKLVDGNDCKGVLAFANPDMIMTTIGEQDVEWIFTPESSNIKPVRGTVKVNVVPGTLNADMPVIQDIAYEPGKKYGDFIKDISATAKGVILEGQSTNESVEGKWTLSDADSEKLIDVTGQTAVTVKMTFTPSNNNNYEPITKDVPVKVVKATPKVEQVPVASEITYKQKLSDSALTGGVVKCYGKDIPGTFTWKDGDTAPSVSDSGKTEYTVLFTPNADNDGVVRYNVVETKITLKVNKATPACTTNPECSKVYYGQKVSESTISGGVVRYDEEAVAGKFEYVTPDKVLKASESVDIKFIPTDSVNYNEITVSVNIGVKATTPTVTDQGDIKINYFEDMTYGTAIPDFAGNATGIQNGDSYESVEGKWSVSSDDKDALVSVGTHSLKFIFTPKDQLSYAPVEKYINVIVNKAKSEFTTIPVASDIVYGKTIHDTTLSGEVVKANGKVLEGQLVIDSVDCMPSEDISIDVRFIPNDSTNYEEVTTKVNVKVLKATPDVTEPGTISIEYKPGKTFSDMIAAINGKGTGITLADGSTEKVTGTWSISDEDKTRTVAAGEYTITMVFTPDKSTNYNEVTASVKVVVAKAELSVSVLPQASGIIYGQKLHDSKLTGGEVVRTDEAGNKVLVDGTFAITDANIIPDKDTLVTVKFTPNDSDNYTEVTTKVNVKVLKATPDVTEPGTISIEYKPGKTFLDMIAAINGKGTGITLADGRTEKVTGTWSISDEDKARTVAAGEYTITMVFTPDKSTNYNEVPASVKVVVAKAELSVSVLPQASDIIYGQKLHDSKLTGGEVVRTDESGNKIAVDGTFAITDDNIMPVEDTGVTVKFTPTDSANYEEVITTVTVKVLKADAVVMSPDTINIMYMPGKTFSDMISAIEGEGTGIILADGSTEKVTGYWNIADEDKAKAVTAGEHTIKVVFIPGKSTNYNEVTASVKVNVAKSSLSINKIPQAADIVYGQKLYDTQFTGGEVVRIDESGKKVAVEGAFVITDDNIIPDKDTEVTVRFTPKDSANYEEVETKVTVKVLKVNPFVTDIPDTINITYAPDKTFSDLIPAVEGEETGITLADGSIEKVTGKWSVTGEDREKLVTVGEHTITMIFTPDKSTNYNEVMGSVKVNVVKSSLSISKMPQASDIVYGQKLHDSKLTGGEVVRTDESGKKVLVDGTFTITDADIIPDKDTLVTVKFTPTDSANYEEVTAKLTVKVIKATPVVAAPETISIEYKPDKTFSDMISAIASEGNGITLEDGSIEKVTGKWSISAEDGKKAVVAGEHTITMVFTPDKSANYNEVTASVKVNVAKSSLSISRMPQASDIVYGQKLNDAKLTGGEVVRTDEAGKKVLVEGTFAIVLDKAQADIIPDKDTLVTVKFTPTDSANYEEVTAKLTVKLVKATPVVTAPGTISIEYKPGKTFSDMISAIASEGNGIALADGSIEKVTGKWNVADAYKSKSVVAGNYTIAMVYTPDKSAYYNEVTANVKVVVKACEHEKYHKVVAKATLSKDGKISYICDNCNKTFKTVQIARPYKFKLSNTSYTYNGKEKKPTVKVYYKNGKKVSSANYTVTYSKGRVDVGAYYVKIKFKGYISGTKTLTFKIYPVKTYITKLKTTKGSNKIDVKWNKVSGVSGYNIQYSTDKAFKLYKSKTVTSDAKNTLTVSKLTKKETYYVRIRTYKTVKIGKKTYKYYSGWSSVKKVKVK